MIKVKNHPKQFKKELDILNKPELRDLLNTLPFYVLLVDARHYILFANKAVREQLKVAPEQIIGKYCPKVIHEMDEPYPGCPLEEAVSAGHSVEKEFFDDKSGRWLNSAIYPTKYVTREGQKIFIHFVQDITDHKQAEEIKRLAMIEERNRIAADLHDDCAQDLAHIIKRLEFCGKLFKINQTKAIAELALIVDNTKEISKSMRQVIFNLKSCEDNDFDLLNKLTAHIKDFEKTNDIMVKFNVSGLINNILASKARSIFYIIKEAFNNIGRHSQAKNVELVLEINTKGNLTVNIKDDGQGFDVKKVQSLGSNRRKWGLIGIRQRTASLGGKLVIRSRSQQGTKIFIDIPVAYRI